LDNLNRHIEHTLLNPSATAKDFDLFIEEVINHKFIGCCVPPFWVKKVSRDLTDFDIQVVTVIGFPFGFHMTETKLEEINIAINNGADELDVVMNISAFKSGMGWAKIELAKCSKLIHDSAKQMKVIIETAYLSRDEIIAAANLAKDAGADFIKTSTGFASQGATIDNVKLLREILPSSVGIKASGGINTREQALQFIEAGADRIGTSSGPILLLHHDQES